MHRRVGISGVELGDDHHTVAPVFFIALPPVSADRVMIQLLAIRRD
jgi:hypothetical protein